MNTKIIGSKIAAARREKNMSQAQLAQLLFISPQAVGKWERGESIPDIITTNRIAEILGVDLNYFSESFQPAEVNMAPGQGVEQMTVTDGNTQSDTGRQLLTNFSGSNLGESDFAGVNAHNRKFNGSALRGADFSAADLTGSSFSGSDIRESNFDESNLTDCTFSASALTDAHFNKTILVRTEFSKLGLGGVKFTDATFTDAKLHIIDLTKTTFDRCTFTGTDFTYCDLRGVCLDGQIFTDVKFDKTALNEATFKGATLRNVSFRASFAITNKYYRALKTIRFEGAIMDKLTYAALKGLGADLSKVSTI